MGKLLLSLLYRRIVSGPGSALSCVMHAKIWNPELQVETLKVKVSKIAAVPLDNQFLSCGWCKSKSIYSNPEVLTLCHNDWLDFNTCLCG
jgi:hypothetical protein